MFTWTFLIVTLAHFTAYASGQTGFEIKCHCSGVKECNGAPTLECPTEGLSPGCRTEKITQSGVTRVEKTCNSYSFDNCLLKELNLGKPGCHSATRKEMKEKCSQSRVRRDLNGKSQPKGSSDTNSTAKTRQYESLQDSDTVEVCACNTDLCNNQPNKSDIFRGGIGLVMISAVIAAVAF